MTKSKRQLRAEAVERLQKSEEGSPVDMLFDAIGVDRGTALWCMYGHEANERLIELLTEDETCPNSNETCPDADGTASNAPSGTVHQPSENLDAQARAEIEDTERSAKVAQDSREKLEADILAWRGKPASIVDMIPIWLDRQAAITEREHPGLTVSDDESLINWHGENYLPQSRVLNAERERDEFSLKLKHEMELNRDNRNAFDLERIDELKADNDYLRDINKKLDYEVRDWKGEAKNQRNNFYQATEARKHWQRKYENLKATSYSAEAPSDESELARELGKALAERDMYRDKLGRAIDAAHEIVRIAEVDV